MKQQKMESRTQDEKYIIALYELAQAEEELSKPLNRYLVGRKINMHERGVNATCKLLLQANFIKKSSEEDIYMTENGIRLAQRLFFGD